MILLYAVPSMNTLVSSANSIENNKSDDLEKSLIYKMKRRDPSMDPWGTPCVFFLNQNGNRCTQQIVP